MMDKEILGLFAVLINVGCYIPYFIGLYRKQLKPHVFSWLLWGLLTGIAFFAQIAAGAGPGAWITGFTTLFLLIITLISLSHGEKNITRSDWASFIIALLAIPLWYVTNDPLWSVILVTAIDALAFYPTFRKSWHQPWQDSATTFFISSVKWIPALMALEIFNLTTALYPASLVIMNGAFVAMLLYRRQKVNKPVI